MSASHEPNPSELPPFATFVPQDPPAMDSAKGASRNSALAQVPGSLLWLAQQAALCRDASRRLYAAERRAWWFRDGRLLPSRLSWPWLAIAWLAQEPDKVRSGDQKRDAEE